MYGKTKIMIINYIIMKNYYTFMPINMKFIIIKITTYKYSLLLLLLKY